MAVAQLCRRHMACRYHYCMYSQPSKLIILIKAKLKIKNQTNTTIKTKSNTPMMIRVVKTMQINKNIKFLFNHALRC